MIDLHCHLLPGIDDGPQTLDEALELCRLAVQDGIECAVVTPHIHPGRWRNSRQSIGQQCDKLQRQLVQNDIPLQLGFAAEVRLTDQLMQQIVAGDIPFYGEVEGYRVMLLEFPHSHLVPGSEKLLAWLLKQKIRPVIAHPERNRQVMKNPEQLRPFLELGCWLQVTAGAVVGRFGVGAQSVARHLLQQDAVSVVASDGHNRGARPPILSEAYAYIADTHGRDRAQRLLLEAPALIVASQFVRRSETDSARAE